MTASYPPQAGQLTDAEIIEQLRKAASLWFRNSDLLLLEELIARLQRANPPIDPLQAG